MKSYYIYLSDFPFEPLPCKALDEKDAESFGNEYIKKWNLNARVVRIEKKVVKGLIA